MEMECPVGIDKKAHKAEYMKAWRAANAERLLAYQTAWRKANREKYTAGRAARRKARPEVYRAHNEAWARANPDKIASYKRAWKKANPEKVRAYGAEYNAAYYKANADKLRANSIAWGMANPEKRCANEAKRRSLKKLAADSSANHKAIRFFFKQAKRLSSLLKTRFEVDHIIPLSKGGLHHENNLQIIPAIINWRKGDRLLQYPVWASPQFSLS